MLTVEALEVLSTLVYLREHEEAKNVAHEVLNTAPVADLWAIQRCAAILDTNNRAVATSKLDMFARDLR